MLRQDQALFYPSSNDFISYPSSSNHFYIPISNFYFSSSNQPFMSVSNHSQPVSNLSLPHSLHFTEDDLFPMTEFPNGDLDDQFFKSLPPGYKFCPLDRELIVHYLKNKITNQLPLPRNNIAEVDFYGSNPETLAQQHERYEDREWYFFTHRERKYPKGKRPRRSAGDGYWKATGSEHQVKYHGEIVGFKRALVFYLGRPPRGTKTNWIMHEYRVADAPPRSNNREDGMRLDDWVLCKLYKKDDKFKPKPHPLNQNQETSILPSNVEGNISNSMPPLLVYQEGTSSFPPSENDLAARYLTRSPDSNDFSLKFNYDEDGTYPPISNYNYNGGGC